MAVTVGAIAALWAPTVVHAHSGGTNGGGCGCHGNGDVDLNVAVSPMMFSPGQQVTVTVSVGQAGANVAGVFVDDDDTGSLGAIGGQGLAVVGSGVTHTSPKSMGGGSAQWSFQWTAPNSPGAVRFTVWGVAANGNGGSSGDDALSAPFDFVYGCNAQEFYRDADGDGFGRTNSPLLHCQGLAPAGYAASPGDCDDNDPDQFPDAIEYCNQVDDDCDGEIDENAVPIEQFPDADGDGYYGQVEYESGETFLGCVPSEGWAAKSGDCRPDDPTIHPGVEETCNGFDDDCDNDVDEFVRPQCGEGWCRRESIGCDPENCTPGEPREEECNFFDDDCDGIVDNDATCPEGEVCQAGECRPEEAASDDATNDGPSSGAGSGDGSAGGDAAGTGGGSVGAGGADGGVGGCTCVSHGQPRGASWLLLALLGVRRRRRAA